MESMNKPPVALLKRTLRRSFAKQLSAIPPTTVFEESHAVTSHLLAHPSFAKAASISIYLSTPTSEIQTDLLVRESLARGKRVFIPFCPQADKTVMRMLRLPSVEAFERLGLNRWGIREVSEEEAGGLEDSEETGGLDMILVPGLLFDRFGQRLGHGRGYYDRFLTGTLDYPARFAKPPPITVALALSEQILPPGERVPVEEWDVKPDLIYTPSGVLQIEQDQEATS